LSSRAQRGTLVLVRPSPSSDRFLTTPQQKKAQPAGRALLFPNLYSIPPLYHIAIGIWDILAINISPSPAPTYPDSCNSCLLTRFGWRFPQAEPQPQSGERIQPTAQAVGERRGNNRDLRGEGQVTKPRTDAPKTSIQLHNGFPPVGPHHVIARDAEN